MNDSKTTGKERDILMAFAEYLDEGFHQDEPFAVKYVDDFLANNKITVTPQCKHKNSIYLGDGDSQCKDCFVIF